MAHLNLGDDRKPSAVHSYALQDDGGQQPSEESTRIDFPLILAELRQQIAALSPERNSAYLQALSKCPSLVENETRPLWFLRQTNFNPVLAATLLAAHWAKRVELFKDKAFLPMALTGEGALNRTDMSMLNSGFFVVLPKDELNNSVLCYDASRLEKQSKEYQLRVAFYLFSVACENSQAQSEGIVLLFLMEQFSGRNPKRQSLQEIVQAMPCRIKEVYCVRISMSPPKCLTESASKEAASMLTSKKMSIAVAGVFGPIQPNQLTLIQGSKERCVVQLEELGLERRSIPKSMGGDWGYESFVQWQELRTRFEWGLPPGVGGKDSSNLFDFATSSMDLKSLTDDEKLERKRRLNVLHSRRKREREKVEVEVLHEQAIELEEKNRALDEDNERLQILLNNASGVVETASFLGSTGPLEQQRIQRRCPGDHDDIVSFPAAQRREISQLPYANQHHQNRACSLGDSQLPQGIRGQLGNPDDESKEHHFPNFADQQLQHRHLNQQLLPSRYQDLFALPQQYHHQPIHPSLLQQFHIQELQLQLAAQQNLLGHLLEQRHQNGYLGQGRGDGNLIEQRHQNGYVGQGRGDGNNEANRNRPDRDEGP